MEENEAARIAQTPRCFFNPLTINDLQVIKKMAYCLHGKMTLSLKAISKPSHFYS